MKVAAIDCGTNTIRLLIEDFEGGVGTEIVRTQEFVGLGQGVDATKKFAPEAMDRAFAACEKYAALIEENHCDKVRFIATSATRDAANREVFLDGIRSRLGIDPEVISGEEEAALGFSGVLSGVPINFDPVLVMDSGGGSTELVRGLSVGTILESVSLDIGSRRVRERYLRHDPPKDREISQARCQVRRLLTDCGMNLESVRTFIGVAGTVTTLSALNQRLPAYDRAKVHGSKIELDELGELTDRLLSMTVAEVAALGPVQPQRAQVLCAGALVVYEVAQLVGSSTLIVSEADILDGIARSML
jgi:exopolyphosphatase/guanosine-5'-triphosphate,3'-diphosphate pyrophosphatase